MVSNKLFTLQQHTGDAHHDISCLAAVSFLATILPVVLDFISLNTMTTS